MRKGVLCVNVKVEEQYPFHVLSATQETDARCGIDYSPCSHDAFLEMDSRERWTCQPCGCPNFPQCLRGGEAGTPAHWLQ